MTERDQLLEQLEQANPVADPSRIYDDAPAAQRFAAAVEAKRAQPSPRLRPWPLVIFRQNTPGWLAAGLAFATVFAVVGVGLVFTQQATDVPVIATTTAPDPTPSTTAPDPTPTTEAPPASTTTEPPPTTTSSTTTSPPTTVPPGQRFALGNPVAPPEGVVSGFGPFIAEGGGLCEDHFGLINPPPVILPETNLSYDGGTGPIFCLAGYDLSRPVEVNVTFEGTPLRSYVLDPNLDIVDDLFLFVWRSLPTDPLGRYEMTALQDGEGDNHTFRVIEPLDPGLTIEPRRIPVGATTQIVLFQFEPNREVPVHFYWIDYDDPAFEENGFTYVSTATVRTDDAGWAVLDVETGGSTRPGTYVVETEKGFIDGILPPYVAHVFDVTR